MVIVTHASLMLGIHCWK